MKMLKMIAIISSLVFVLSLGACICFAAIAYKEGSSVTLADICSGNFRANSNEMKSITSNDDGVADILINAGASKVTLVREDRQDIDVDYTSYIFGSQPVLMEQKGDTLEIKTTDITQHFTFFEKLQLTIRIPQNYNGNLTLVIGAGALAISGKQQFNNVSISVGAGAVSIDDIQANSLKSDVSVGKLTANHLSVGTLTLKVGTGEADINGLTGSTDLTVNMGEAILEYDHLTGNIAANVNAGGATIRLPSDTPATLNLSAKMGTVSQNFGSHFKGESADNYINGVLNNGGNTISGEVDMGTFSVESR